MSADIEYQIDKDTCVMLEITPNVVLISIDAANPGHEYCPVATAVFNMKDESNRQMLKEMITHLQHQIDIHEENK